MLLVHCASEANKNRFTECETQQHKEVCRILPKDTRTTEQWCATEDQQPNQRKRHEMHVPHPSTGNQHNCPANPKIGYYSNKVFIVIILAYVICLPWHFHVYWCLRLRLSLNNLAANVWFLLCLMTPFGIGKNTTVDKQTSIFDHMWCMLGDRCTSCFMFQPILVLYNKCYKCWDVCY